MSQLRRDVEEQATLFERAANQAARTVREYAGHLNPNKLPEPEREAEDRARSRIALKRLQTELEALVIWVDGIHDALSARPSEEPE